MRWVSTVSGEPDLAAAVLEAASTLRAALAGQDPDLLVAFVSEHHRGAYDRLPALVARHFGSALLLGCSAGGVIGGGREVEGRAGLSLTAAVLPDVDVIPLHIGPDAATRDVLEHVPVAAEPHFILLPDPFSFDSEGFVHLLDQAFPASTKIGGLASGAREPGGNALYLGDAVHHEGLVGVALTGNLAVDTIVAQGCRPVGEPMFVTRAERNVIRELDGRRPLEVLQELHVRAPAADKPLFQNSLFLGIVMREAQAEYHQGDFLIRNLVGMDPKSGALAVGALVHDNQVVQFHLRDARTSADDLEQLLRRYEDTPARPTGSLLFSCLGRGMHLYGAPDHDTGAFQKHLGDVPLGGFFCNGEIGPVQGTTFLHGYTSAFGLFRARR
jgi:small ligand-binding sensory domain FIST